MHAGMAAPSRSRSELLTVSLVLCRVWSNGHAVACNWQQFALLVGVRLTAGDITAETDELIASCLAV